MNLDFASQYMYSYTTNEQTNIVSRFNDYPIAIDECSGVADCVADASCINTADGFMCLCPSGYQGDGRMSGEGCTGKQIKVMYIEKRRHCGSS